MKTITLGKTGIKVKQLGFGAMHIPRISKEESDKVLNRALELGVNYFDTAAAYQDSEEKLGRVLSEKSREDYEEIGKIGTYIYYPGGDEFFDQGYSALSFKIKNMAIKMMFPLMLKLGIKKLKKFNNLPEISVS